MLFLLVGLAVGGLAGAYWALSNQYLSPPRGLPPLPGHLREVWVDGNTPAWTTPRLAEGEALDDIVFVLVHGYRGHADHFSGFMSLIDAAGYEAIAPQLAAHGDSPLPRVGFTRIEVEQVRATLAWVRRQVPGSPRIVLYGLSMGGAVSLLVTETEPDLQAVVVEGAFPALDEAADIYLDKALPMGSRLLAPMRWIVRWRTGVNESAVRPIDAARTWAGRSLVIHAEADDLMPRAFADRLAGALNSDLWVVPSAGHAEVCHADPEGLLERLIELAR